MTNSESVPQGCPFCGEPFDIRPYSPQGGWMACCHSCAYTIGFEKSPEALTALVNRRVRATEPPQPRAIVQTIGGHFHGFASDTDALAFRRERDDAGISQHSVCYSWTWHPHAGPGCQVSVAAELPNGTPLPNPPEP